MWYSQDTHEWFCFPKHHTLQFTQAWQHRKASQDDHHLTTFCFAPPWYVADFVLSLHDIFWPRFLQTDTRTEIRILNDYARFHNRFFVWGAAGDMESVFGERLISSYGALPDLHASNHITIILTMTLLPCMALVAMYILINSPELQTKVFPECDPIHPEILVQSLPSSIFKFSVSTYLKCETGEYGWGCSQMLIIFVWCVLFIGGRARNLWGQHSHVRRRISLLCRSFRTFRPWRWLLGVWTWRAYVCVCVCVCVIMFVCICVHICIYTCM